MTRKSTRNGKKKSQRVATKSKGKKSPKLKMTLTVASGSMAFTEGFFLNGAVLFFDKWGVAYLHLRLADMPAHQLFFANLIRYIMRSGIRTAYVKQLAAYIKSGRHSSDYHIIPLAEFQLTDQQKATGALIDCAARERRLVLELDDRRPEDSDLND